MEEVLCCTLCKSCNEDGRFTDLSGALLENVIKIKLLGDVPVDTSNLSLRGDPKICRYCLDIVDDIRFGLIKLKDRVVKRNYPHHAQFLLNHPVITSLGTCTPNRRQSPSSLAMCDSAEDGEGTSSSETECSSFCDKGNVNIPLGEQPFYRRRSSGSLISDPLLTRMNCDRDVRIRVPPSINATFIVMETMDNDDQQVQENNVLTQNTSPLLPKSVQSLLNKNKISDVIDSSSFKHAHHVDVGAKIEKVQNSSVEVLKPPQSDANLPVKKDNPVQAPREYTHYIKKRRLSYSAGDSGFGFAQTLKTDNSDKPSTNMVTSRSLTTSPVREVNGNTNHKPLPETKALDLTQPAHDDLVHVVDKSKEGTGPRRTDESSNSCDSLRKLHRFIQPFDRFSREALNGQASPPVLPVRKRRSLGNILESRSLPTPPPPPPQLTPPAPVMMSEACNGDVQEVRHVCDICGGSFERQSLLNQHITWHHSDPNFTCSVCGMKFGEKFGLHIHESQEHNMRPMIPLMLPPPIPPLPPEQTMTSSTPNPGHQEPMSDMSKPNMDIPVHISKEAFLKSRKKIQYCEDCREHFTSKYDLLRHRVTTGHMGGAGGVCLDREEASSTCTFGIDSLQRQKRMARMPQGQVLPNPGQPMSHFAPILPKSGDNPLGLLLQKGDLDQSSYRPGRKGRPRKTLPGTNRRLSVPDLMHSGTGSDGLRHYDFTDENSDSMPVKSDPYKADFKDSRPNSPRLATRPDERENPRDQLQDSECVLVDGQKIHLKYAGPAPSEDRDGDARLPT